MREDIVKMKRAKGNRSPIKKMKVVAVALIMASICLVSIFNDASNSLGSNPEWLGSGLEDAGFTKVVSRESSGETVIDSIEGLIMISNQPDSGTQYIQIRDLDINDPDSYESHQSYLDHISSLGWEIRAEVVSAVPNNGLYDVTFQMSYQDGGSGFVPLDDASIQYVFGRASTGSISVQIDQTGSITVPGSLSGFDGVTPTAFLIGGTMGGATYVGEESKFALSMFVSGAGDVRTSHHMGNFAPIGSNNAKFNGSYNGNGYSIIGMEVSAFTAGAGVTRIDPYMQATGMFGVISGTAIIENVRLTGGSVTSSMISDRVAINYGTRISSVGGLVGYAYAGAEITNCFNDRPIIASSGAGGIVGLAEGMTTVSYCTNEGDIETQGSYVGGIAGDSSNTVCSINRGNITGGAYVAGIMGVAGGGTQILNNINYGNVKGFGARVGGIGGDVGISMSNCINYGDVESTTGDYTGGIVGLVTVLITISNCINHGDVKAVGQYMGGVVGYFNSSGSISNCINYGGIESSNQKAGGIVGQTNNGSISCSVNYGNMSFNSNSGGIVGYASGTLSLTDLFNYGHMTLTGGYSGGIVGHINTVGVTISNSHNHGNITTSGARIGGIVGNMQQIAGLSYCSNTGEINGTGMVGGIVGYAVGASISNLINKGSVTSPTASGHAGGILGQGHGTKISISANYGNIAGQYVGGIVGSLSDTGESTISHCYNVGNVTGGNNSRAGGIIGTAFLTTLEYVYNYSTAVQGSNGLIGTSSRAAMQVNEAYYPDSMRSSSNVTIGSPIQITDFKSRSTFSTWFNALLPWAIDDGIAVNKINDGMPYFSYSIDFTVVVDGTEQKVFHGDLAKPIGVSVTGMGSDVVEYQWQSSTDGYTWDDVPTNSKSPFLTFKDPILASDPLVQYRCVVTSLIPNGGGDTSGISEIGAFYGFELQVDLPMNCAGELEYSFTGTEAGDWIVYGGRVMLEYSGTPITAFYVRGPEVATEQGTIRWNDGLTHSSGRTWAYSNGSIADNLVLTAELGYVVNVSVDPTSLGEAEYRMDHTGQFEDVDGAYILFGMGTTSLELSAIEKVGGEFDKWSTTSGDVFERNIDVTSVKGPMSFVANFKVATSFVTVTDVGGGTTDPTYSEVNYGGNLELTFNPTVGWKVSTVRIGSGDTEPVSGSTYTILDIKADMAVTVEYVMDPSALMIIGQPSNVTLEYLRDTTFSISTNVVSGVTYQWQVNTGTGWSNTSDAGHYSGTTTSTLGISDVPLSMEGWQFRCLATYAGNTQESDDASINVTWIIVNDVHDLLAIGYEALYPADGYYMVTESFDCTLSSSSYVPIGTELDPFTGEFDGNHHVISNLQVDTSSNGHGAAGLFGYVSGSARIFEVVLSNGQAVAGGQPAGGLIGAIASGSSVIVTDCHNGNDVSSQYISGGIVGFAGAGMIVDCTNSGIVTTYSTLGNVYAGGIVGYMEGGTISACENQSPVTVESESAASANAGGIVGRAMGSIVKDSINSGAVSIPSTNLSVNASVGGIAGYVGPGTQISYSENQADVSAHASSFSYVGGIVGYVSGTSSIVTVSDCTNLAVVTSSAPDSRAGGIAGFARNMSATDCVNSGEVCGYTAFTTGSTVYVGGIAGRLESSILEECVNDGAVMAPTVANPGDDGSFRYWLGGMAGDMIYGSSIEGCTNNGIVSANVPVGTSHLYIGGLVGHMYQGTSAINCTNANQVMGTNESVKGLFVYAGGIAGVALGTSTKTVTMTNCDNIGTSMVPTTVIATAANARAGGILGYGNYVTVSGCDSNGDVLGSGGSESYGVSDASVRSGGIAGYLENSTVSTCTASGNVSAMTLSANGLPRAGGIVGSMVMGTSLTRCTASGDVVANAGIRTSGKAYAGGIAGLTEGTISGCTYASSALRGTVTSIGFNSGAGGIVGMGNSGTVVGIAYANVIAEYTETIGKGRAGVGAGYTLSTVTVTSTGSSVTPTTTPVAPQP